MGGAAVVAIGERRLSKKMAMATMSMGRGEESGTAL